MIDKKLDQRHIPQVDLKIDTEKQNRIPKLIARIIASLRSTKAKEKIPTFTSPELTPELITLIENKLQSIFLNGLLIPKDIDPQLQNTSATPAGNHSSHYKEDEIISGVVLPDSEIPQDELITQTKRGVETALNPDSPFGVFGVMIERARERYRHLDERLTSGNPEDLKIVQERILLSILIGVNCKDISFPFMRETDPGTRPMTAPRAYHLTDKSIPSQLFEFILVPDHLFPLVERIARESAPAIAPRLKRVDTVSRSLFGKTLFFPNYQKNLEEWLLDHKEFERKNQIFIHGVRLPTSK